MELLFNLIIYVPATLLRGWVIMILWNWYALPIAKYGLQIVPAIGISILSTILTAHQIDTRKKTIEEKIEGYILVFVFPLMMLLFGWFWRQFI